MVSTLAARRPCRQSALGRTTASASRLGASETNAHSSCRGARSTRPRTRERPSAQVGERTHSPTGDDKAVMWRSASITRACAADGRKELRVEAFGCPVDRREVGHIASVQAVPSARSGGAIFSIRPAGMPGCRKFSVHLLNVDVRKGFQPGRA